MWKNAIGMKSKLRIRFERFCSSMSGEQGEDMAL